MSTAETPQPEVVVGDDGSLLVPAETLARFGIEPGAHLRLIREPGGATPIKRKSVMGVLEGKIDADAIEEGLAWGKQDRIEQALREDDNEQ